MTPHTPRPTWIPPVSCSCGQPHHPGARYFVSVLEHDGGPCVLAAGPYRTHQEALARVTVVNDLVLARYNPEGRAHWYLYGTVAMPHDDAREGKLNAEVLARIEGKEPTP